jgi:hypothetical protein
MKENRWRAKHIKAEDGGGQKGSKFGSLNLKNGSQPKSQENSIVYAMCSALIGAVFMSRMLQ